MQKSMLRALQFISIGQRSKMIKKKRKTKRNDTLNEDIAELFIHLFKDRRVKSPLMYNVRIKEATYSTQEAYS